jgi:hypothetical protein
MARILYDEFTDLPISNVQRYQLRKQKRNECRVCTDQKVTAHYCAAHAIAANAQDKKWKKDHPEQTLAIAIVNRAIRSGELIREKCEKCNDMGEAHHEDYSKPLEVRWLCHKHHVKEHQDKKIK